MNHMGGGFVWGLSQLASAVVLDEIGPQEKLLLWSKETA
jgi:hypothetical protein